MIDWPLAGYVMLGPLAWVAMWAGLLLARSRMNRLERPTPPLPDVPPHVSILVPAKDEQADITACIDRIVAQDYPSFDVIAIDDRSRDRTGELLDTHPATRAGRVRVLHVADLPPGWLGKCHALHVATPHVRGEWILFVDSDVHLEPQALRHVLAIALQRRYDAVSLLTRLRAETFWEKLVLPPAAISWGMMFQISLTNDDGLPRCAAANGQFFLVRADAYRGIGGHEAVRSCIVEDVELMRALKSAGACTRLFTGFHLAATRMQTSLRQIFHGWARIYAGTSRRRVHPMLGGIVFLAACVLGGYAALGYALATGRTSWLVASAAHLLLMHAYLGYAYLRSHVNVLYSLLAPLAAVTLMAMMSFAITRCLGGRIDWRGTRIDDHSREGFQVVKKS
jgi:chlorobactene glucosyltransferase